MQVPDDQQLPRNVWSGIMDCGLPDFTSQGTAGHSSRSVQNGEVTEIVFPQSGELRARKIVSRSSSRAKGKYPSWKMNRMIQWESENELKAFRLLDCDPEVSRFNEQPCEILYVLDGQTKRHCPDILVERSGGQKELLKVKPDSKALEPEVATRTALLIKSLPIWGYSYRIVLATDLATQPRERNAFFLLGFGRRTATDCERELIRRSINQRGSLVWSDACRGEYGPRGRETLCSLVLRGVLAIDMDLPISPDTRFGARKGEF